MGKIEWNTRVYLTVEKGYILLLNQRIIHSKKLLSN